MSMKRKLLSFAVFGAFAFVSAVALAGAPQLVFFKGKDGMHYFHVRAANGKIVLKSEGYEQKGGAVNGAKATLKLGKEARNYKIRNNAKGSARPTRWWFNLIAPNNKIVSGGETYPSLSNATRGIRDAVSVVKQVKFEAGKGAGQQN
jgi:hypothetical protein